MYNGVGLATPRGSGTSGHVQRNCAAVFKKEKSKHKEENKAEPLSRQPNKEILEHTRKRDIELKCLELSDALEEQGYTQDEIDAKVESYRKMLLDNFEKSNKDKKQLDEYGRPVTKDSHQTAEAQIERNAKLRDAFGLDPKTNDEDNQNDLIVLEEQPTKKSENTEERSSKKHKDTEEKPSKNLKDSEERSSKKSKDSEERSSKKSKGSEERSSKKSKGSEEKSSKRSKDSKERSSRKSKHSEERSSKRSKDSRDRSSKKSRKS